MLTFLQKATGSDKKLKHVKPRARAGKRPRGEMRSRSWLDTILSSFWSTFLFVAAMIGWHLGKHVSPVVSPDLCQAVLLLRETIQDILRILPLYKLWPGTFLGCIHKPFFCFSLFKGVSPPSLTSITTSCASGLGCPGRNLHVFNYFQTSFCVVRSFSRQMLFFLFFFCLG